MRTNRLLVLAIVLIVTMVVTYASFSPRPGSVRYHVDRLSYLRQPLHRDAPALDNKGLPIHRADYFRFRTWRWYWRGGLSFAKLIEEREKHQQALIQLGYYERREFTLTNRIHGAQLFPMITNAVHGEQVWLLGDSSKDRWLRVTARKADMPLVELAIVTYDTSVTK